MGAISRAGASGLILGLVVIFLGQQFGFVDLTNFVGSIEQLLIAAAIGGIVFGLLGIWLGRRARRKISTAPKEWVPPSSETGTGGASPPPQT